MSRNAPPSHLRRIAIACALAAALLLLPLPASAGIVWDIGAAVGYAALVCAAVLYVYPLRGDGIAHRRLFSLSQHRRIGWLALSLGVAHAAILLAAQPLVGHYLLPSAPLYMWCGVAALIALAVLVATGLSARTALRRIAPARGSPPSAATHAVLAASLLGLSGAHIVGSGQLIDRPSKTITVCVLLALPLLWAALRPRSTPLRTRLLFTVAPSCLGAIALLLLPTPTGGSYLLQPAIMPSVLHVHFPHDKHTAVNCVACHHNFVDMTGFGGCLDCHRSTRADLHQSGEATFHLFCRDCHRDLALQGDKHGPVRACSNCHMDKGPES